MFKLEKIYIFKQKIVLLIIFYNHQITKGLNRIDCLVYHSSYLIFDFKYYATEIN